MLALPPQHDRALSDAVQLLAEALRDKLPWSALALEYLLSVDPTITQTSQAAVLRTVLVSFRRLWVAQGAPHRVADLNLTTLTRTEQQSSGTLARVVEAALWSGRAPESLLADVQQLLPDVFIRPLGWSNLAGHLTPAVLALLEARSESVGGAVPDRYQKIALRLFAYRHRPYVGHLAFAAAALMGEQRFQAAGRQVVRNRPASILSLLSGAASALDSIFRAYHVTRIEDVHPDTQLLSYARTTGGNLLQETRAAQAQRYWLCTEAQQRWCQSHATVPQLYRDWHLPNVSDTHAAELCALVKRSQRKGKFRRQAQVKAVEPHVRDVFSMVVMRDTVICGIHDAYRIALRSFQSQSEPRPVAFSYTTPDGSATLWFACWTPNLLSDADQQLVARSDHRGRPMRNSVVTEYLGAVGRSGDELPQQPFFAEVIRAWYDTSLRDRFVDAGLPADDLRACRTGFLRPSPALGAYISRYTAASVAIGRSPRVLMDMDSIHMGVTVAMFVLCIGLSTGMRIHEIQQLRADPEGSRQLADGTIEVAVWPKNQKGGAPVTHIIEAQFAPLWTRVMNAHDQQWEFFEKIVPIRAICTNSTSGFTCYRGGAGAFAGDAVNPVEISARWPIVPNWRRHRVHVHPAFSALPVRPDARGPGSRGNGYPGGAGPRNPGSIAGVLPGAGRTTE
ncbi:hypothetical protein MF271_01150 (plasmid) [Deinococcus sp. KNUC1210]|uniref:hypothetical protein n=1 Tax=Deinococcus sp. KNUC1210 TaxID=2917691 RepID=UPI001EEFD2CC|nr:hypothetical protein [Deinococcus sp. KNUC1210]ULH13967.1 hypothetical protein MF271_01150 [Deinococcus sp. KNUC1210]